MILQKIYYNKENIYGNQMNLYVSWQILIDLEIYFNLKKFCESNRFVEFAKIYNNWKKTICCFYILKIVATAILFILTMRYVGILSENIFPTWQQTPLVDMYWIFSRKKDLNGNNSRLRYVSFKYSEMSRKTVVKMCKHEVIR